MPRRALAEPEVVLEAEDDRAIEEELEAETQRWVAVEGETEDCGIGDGGGYYIRFRRSDFEAKVTDEGATTLITQKDIPAEEYDARFEGKEIRILGRIELRGDKPVIRITDARQILMAEE